MNEITIAEYIKRLQKIEAENPNLIVTYSLGCDIYRLDPLDHRPRYVYGEKSPGSEFGRLMACRSYDHLREDTLYINLWEVEV